MHVLTFDIEDWFHLLEHEETSNENQWCRYESRIVPNTDLILDCLAEAQVKATFFCLGWIARAHPEVIKMIHAAGHEIGSHSDNHQLVYRLTPQQFREDLRNSIKSLEDVTGAKVRAYRSPGFSITRESIWAWSILAENGIEFDSSIFASRHSHGGFRDFRAAGPVQLELGGGITLKQFPVLPGRYCGCSVSFSGGGYFRLLPYPFVRLLMSRAEYAMTYFHPRDFDANQPLVCNLPAHRVFKSYVGLRSCLRKFKRLLREFNLVDLATADSMIDWAVQPRMQVGAH
jgi:peptidoglycan-N-acetylglucosamine deacetylase